MSIKVSAFVISVFRIVHSIEPDYFIVVLQLYFRRTVIRFDSVDLVQPAALLSGIELIQVIDAFDVLRTIG